MKKLVLSLALIFNCSLAKVDFVGEFSDGLAKFTKDGKTGFIDKKAQVVIPAKYEGWLINFLKV